MFTSVPDHPSVVCSVANGSILWSLAREDLVPRPELSALYERGGDLDGDGVDDFVVNLGSRDGPLESDCSFAYSGRDLSLLRKLR